MIWLNVLVLLIIIGFIYVENHRGFGRAIFDLIGGLLTVIPGSRLAELGSKSVQIMANDPANRAFWLVIVFVGGAAVTLLVGKVIHEATLVSLDVLDPAGGALLGVAIGILVAYALLAILMQAAGASDFVADLNSCFVTQEFFHFRSYHKAIEALRHIGEWEQ